MSAPSFVDYYELLQVSSNADTDTIERIFRHLAKKFHPDNPASSDEDRFHEIVAAHRTLIDPVARAGYDVKYQDYWNRKWRIASEAGDGAALGDDHAAREHLLSLLYIQRRRDMGNPGMGEYELQRLLGIPREQVEFHMWYLRCKDWIERLDTGQMAISALGVDQVEQSRLRLRPDRLIEAHSIASARRNPKEEATLYESSEIPLELPVESTATSDKADR